MKRLALCLALVALIMAACNHDKNGNTTDSGRTTPLEFTTNTFSGKQCYTLTYDEQMGPWGNTVALKKTYSLAWPAEGTLSTSAERELMQLCFGDSSSADIAAAASAWLSKPYIYDEDGEAPHIETVDSFDESSEFCYCDVECAANHDSTLATFLVKMESYAMGAHGFYSADYLTVDLETGNAVHLDDLVVDTGLLCSAIARAIQDLEVNRDVRECLYDEFRNVDRMPLPRNFFIDSARNSIIVVYGLYDIQPYACGIPSVVLPIFWLSKHVGLTPYAKRLFGPDSYIKE